MEDRLYPVEDTEYAHLTGRIRGIEARMLSAQQFQRLAEASSAAEVARQLGETDYRQLGDFLDRGLGYDEALERVLGQCYGEMRALSPDPAPVELVECGRMFGRAAARARQGEPVNGETGLEPGELAGKVPHEIDARLERKRYEYMLTRAAGSALLEQLVAFWADLTNLQSMLRAKLLGRRSAFLADKLLPGGRERQRLLQAVGEPWEQLPRLFSQSPLHRVVSVAAAEALDQGSLPSLGKAVDDAVTEFARRSRRVAMGPEAVAGFLLGRELEVKNLRLIFQGVSLGLAAVEIQRRLRQPYA